MAFWEDTAGIKLQKLITVFKGFKKNVVTKILTHDHLNKDTHYTVLLLHYICIFLHSHGLEDLFYLQLCPCHPRIPRGDSARYIDPWDN